jgi:phosphoribosylaminoimidazole-succinocarboxamide synthase
VEKLEELYRGKAKSVYATDDPGLLWMHFRDDTSAFDGEKKAQLSRKGMVNNHFNAFVMERLAEGGLDNHFVRLIGDTDSLVRRLDMIRVECVVRNHAAGSLCRRLGVEESVALDPPVFEFFLKDDALHDPMINDSHIRTFGWASTLEVEAMKERSLRVNGILSQMFSAAGLLLVDFKLEFGRLDGRLILGDEFSPDGCRVWDAASRRKLDKDRFRQGLGEVVESYEEIARRIGVTIPSRTGTG